jgi:hypothetical protein
MDSDKALQDELQTSKQKLEKIREGLRLTKPRSLIICPFTKYFCDCQLQPDVMVVTYSTYWEYEKGLKNFRV